MLRRQEAFRVAALEPQGIPIEIDVARIFNFRQTKSRQFRMGHPAGKAFTGLPQQFQRCRAEEEQTLQRLIVGFRSQIEEHDGTGVN